MKNRRAMFTLILLVVVAAGIGLEGLAQEHTYDELSRLLTRSEEILDQAIYLAAAGIASYDESDQYAYAQGVINLLEGPDSTFYDDTATVPRDFPGLLPFVESLDESDGFGTVISQNLSNAEVIQFYQAYETVRDFIRLAVLSARQAKDLVYSLTGLADAFRVTYAQLVVARGEVSDPSLLEGLVQLVDMLPGNEIWVTPTESIQEALDRLPDGGTIKLVAGTYEESLVVTKNATIEQAIDTHSGNPLLGQTVIQGVKWKTAILVSSDEPITLTLKDISVTDAAVGIQIRGQAIVEGQGLQVSDSGIGMEVLDHATARFTDYSVFMDNGTAIRCYGSGRCELTDCFVQECTDQTGAIFAREQASLVVTRCSITGNRGSGIEITESVNLDLRDSSLFRNFAYGLLVGADVCDEMTQTFASSTFTGNVSGSNNQILAAGSSYGNWLGAICPENQFDFLIEDSSTDAGRDAAGEGGEQ
jgi:hypothetical protein